VREGLRRRTEGRDLRILAIVVVLKCTVTSQRKRVRGYYFTYLKYAHLRDTYNSVTEVYRGLLGFNSPTSKYKVPPWRLLHLLPIPPTPHYTATSNRTSYTQSSRANLLQHQNVRPRKHRSSLGLLQLRLQNTCEALRHILRWYRHLHSDGKESQGCEATSRNFRYVSVAQGK
jgi:hypothetical protein